MYSSVVDLSSFFGVVKTLAKSPSTTCIVFVGNYIIGLLLLNAICTYDGFNLRIVAITPAHSCMFNPLLPTPVDKRKQHIYSYPLKSCFFLILVELSLTECTWHRLNNMRNTHQCIILWFPRWWLHLQAFLTLWDWKSNSMPVQRHHKHCSADDSETICFIWIDLMINRQGTSQNRKRLVLNYLSKLKNTTWAILCKLQSLPNIKLNSNF